MDYTVYMGHAMSSQWCHIIMIPWGRCLVDVIQLIWAEYRQDRWDLVYFSPTLASGSIRSICSHLWCLNTGVISVRPWNICWLGLVDEDPHLEDCIRVFDYSSSDPQHMLLCTRPVFQSLDVMSDQSQLWLYFWLPKWRLDQLQLVLNAVASMVYLARWNEHMSSLLCDLH